MHVTIRQTLCALVTFTSGFLLIATPLRAGVLDGIGSIGTEYESAHPSGLANMLQTHRGLNFGGAGLPYAFGGANADSASILFPGGQVSKLITQVQAGNITLAIISIGDNDYIDVAGQIASGALSGPALTALQSQVVSNIATAVNAVRAEGAHVVLGGFADILYSPAAAGILAVPEAAARLENALAAGRELVSDFAISNGIPFIDFFQLQKEVYENGSAQIGGVDLILSGYGADPHYFFKDPFHAGILVRGAMTNFFIQAINEGYGTNISLLSDLEILALAGLEDEYVEETFVEAYAYAKYVAVPEPASAVLVAMAVASGLAICLGKNRRTSLAR